jgi:hypothetical protein
MLRTNSLEIFKSFSFFDGDGCSAAVGPLRAEDRHVLWNSPTGSARTNTGNEWKMVRASGRAVQYSTGNGPFPLPK